ncbi:MAG: DUF4221 domain-containing protein [Staphylococcus sp.]|nr:DUF4221 domain-containing protein [Staphylococcus sp.]
MEVQSGKAETRTVTIKANPTLVNMSGYGLSSYCHADNSIYAYNYKEHSIDILDLDCDSVSRSIKLATDGPNVVMRELMGLQVYAPDTIAAFDYTAIKVLDGEGKLLTKIELHDGSVPQIDCNSRSHISGFKIDFERHTVMYPTMDRETMKVFEVVEYDYSDRKILDSFMLDGPGRDGNFGFMNSPNVSINGDYIIYNYPFESEIHILDTKTRSSRTVSPQSTLAPGVVAEYDNASSEDSGWYGAENYFYTPLYYIAGKDCYVRITLGKTSLERTNDCDRAYYDRPIYLMTFDKDFNPTGEFEVGRHIYNPFGEWCPLFDCMAFYQDSMFGEPDGDNITLDLVSF